MSSSKYKSRWNNDNQYKSNKHKKSSKYDTKSNDYDTSLSSSKSSSHSDTHSDQHSSSSHSSSHSRKSKFKPWNKYNNDNSKIWKRDKKNDNRHGKRWNQKRARWKNWVQTMPTPTPKPTMSPTNYLCNLPDECVEIAIIVDNSANLNDDECSIQNDAITELLTAIKNDETNTVITLIDIYGEGCMNLVPLNDDLNDNILDYITFIKSRQCLNGHGQTDLLCGFDVAINELIYNGHPNDCIQKIISINNCKEEDSNLNIICNEFVDEIDQFEIDVIFINALPKNFNHGQCGYGVNSIIDPNLYELCMTDNNPDRICVAQTITNDEYKKAINQCIPEICETPTHSQTTDQPTTAQPTTTRSPTASPTAEPTAEPTQSPTDEPTTTASPTASPTEEPTAEPTESPTPEPTTTSASPTASPTDEPTPEPTQWPTPNPSYGNDEDNDKKK